MGTFGWLARSFARTQRARARRDQVGKNWRESARAWAKLVIFISFSVRFVTLQPHHRAHAADDLSPRAESPIGIVLHVPGSHAQIGDELGVCLFSLGAILDPQQE